MTDNEMILFTKDKLQKVLTSLEIATEEKNGKDILINPETEEPATCEACDTELNTENVGHIAHGSHDFYCKNPACFAHFIAKRKLWE